MLRVATLFLGLMAVVDCSGRSKRERSNDAGGDRGGADAGGPSQGGGSMAGSNGEAGSTPAGEGGEATGGSGAEAGAGASSGGSGSGGSGGGSGEGGSGGVASTAGSGIAGGIGGISGNATAGSGGTSVPPRPGNWTCTAEAWSDGRCHCGCGTIDWDCHEWTLEECEVCDDATSCSARACPGTIDPELVVRCAIPWNWTCEQRAYHDGNECDCGCGVIDPDCASESVESCDRCNGGCSAHACPATITPIDNSTCTVPPGWTCQPEYYGNGYCDCGCGIVDWDCASALVEACDFCSNGCGEAACPGTIAPADNSTCDRPPPRWTCADASYADGICHCGCGNDDLDCESDTLEHCEICDAPGSCSGETCPGRILPDYNSGCYRPE